MSKYDPLCRFLRRRAGDPVRLDFDEIELILRALLPKAAREPNWWSNQRPFGRRAPQCRSWLDAGYRAELRAPRIVLFTAIDGAGPALGAVPMSTVQGEVADI